MPRHLWALDGSGSRSGFLLSIRMKGKGLSLGAEGLGVIGPRGKDSPQSLSLEDTKERMFFANDKVQIYGLGPRVAFVGTMGRGGC